MNQRTLVKISAEENAVTLRTVSRAYHSPQGFIILRHELENLKVKKRVIVSDIRSFAVLRLYQTPAGLEVIDLDFSWLSDAGDGRLSGKEESVRLSYDDFVNCIEESLQFGGQYRKLLSLPEGGKPKIEFKSSHHLGEVVKKSGSTGSWENSLTGILID